VSVCFDSVKLTKDSLLTDLNRSYPKLRDQWAKIAFIWAINSTDPGLASRSFKLFQRLHNHYVGQVSMVPLHLALGLDSDCHVALRNAYAHSTSQTCTHTHTPCANLHTRYFFLSLSWRGLLCRYLWRSGMTSARKSLSCLRSSWYVPV